jgi:hypothetical protein
MTMATATVVPFPRSPERILPDRPETCPVLNASVIRPEQERQFSTILSFRPEQERQRRRSGGTCFPFPKDTLTEQPEPPVPNQLAQTGPAAEYPKYPK